MLRLSSIKRSVVAPYRERFVRAPELEAQEALAALPVENIRRRIDPPGMIAVGVAAIVVALLIAGPTGQAFLTVYAAILIVAGVWRVSR